MIDYNRRFARAPMNHHDAHRPVQSSEVLSEVFTWQEERTMTRNLVVHYQRRSYLIVPSPESLGFAGRRVCLYEAADGQVEIPLRRPPPALYRARQATSRLSRNPHQRTSNSGDDVMAALTPLRWRVGIICCALLVASAAACAALAKPAPKPSEFALAKEYLFAACISAQYKDKEIGKEAEVWAGGIVENGNQEAAVYGEIANLAKTLTAAPENTISGTLMRLKSCLRLYDSPDAAKKLKRLVK